MTPLDELLEFALEAARRAGAVALDRYRREPARRRKHDGTWVTEADTAAEAALRDMVARRWPDHNVLGEEEGLAGATGGPARPGAPTWIVDPIDGTNNFIAGIPVWATLVALRLDGKPVVGVAHAPALGETYDAARGLGARFNGAPARVDPLAQLGEATVLHGGEHALFGTGLEEPFRELVRRARRTRGFGDFWGHVLVARGAAHVMLEPELSLWDVAALIPILSEAGGRLTHADGRPFTGGSGSALSTNGALHDEVVALLAPPQG